MGDPLNYRRLIFSIFFIRICFWFFGSHYVYAQQVFERDKAIFNFLEVNRDLRMKLSTDTLPPATGYVKLVVRDTSNVYLVFPSGRKVNLKLAGSAVGAGSGTITSVNPGWGMLGGGALGDVTVTVDSTKLATKYDISAMISNGALAGGDLTGTYPAPAIGTGKVTSAHILDGTIASTDLASSSVTSVKIQDGTIIAQDLASDAVTGAKVLAGTLDSTDLANNSVTSLRLRDSTVNTIDLAPLAVTTSRIALLAVDSTLLASGGVTSTKIKDGEVNSGDLATGAVTTAKLASGAVDSVALATGSVTSVKVKDGALNAVDIASSQVVTGINGGQDNVVIVGAGGAVITNSLHAYPTPDTITITAGGGGGGGSISGIQSANARISVTAPTGPTTTLSIPDAGIDSAALASNAVTSGRIKDGSVEAVDAKAGAFMVPADSTTMKNSLLKNADSTSIRNYSGALYLKNADSTSIRNYSSSLYLKNADSTTLKNGLLKNADSTTLKNGLLKNADSTTIRNYDNALYLKNADSVSIRNRSNALYLKNADSTSIRNYSGTLYQAKGSYLVPADSLTIRTYSNALYQSKATYLTPSDSTTSRTYSDSRYLKNADSTTARTYSNSLYQSKGTYLVPSDSTSIRNRSNVLYQAAGTYLVPSDSISIRNYSTSLYSATGHNHTLDGLSNVDMTGKAAGAVIKWNGSKWVDSTDFTSGTVTFGSLADVDTTGKVVGSVIKWNGTKWVDSTDAGAGGSYLVPADSVSMRNYSGTLYQSKGTYLVPSDSTSIRNRSNVLYQAAGTYLVPSDSTSIRNRSNALYSLTTHNHTLDALSNVDMTGKAAGAVIKWNGTNWVDSTDQTSGTVTLGGLTDVDTTGKVAGEVLTWNGSKWVDSTMTSGGSTVSANDITLYDDFVHGITFNFATGGQNLNVGSATQRSAGNLLWTVAGFGSGTGVALTAYGGMNDTLPQDSNRIGIYGLMPGAYTAGIPRGGWLSFGGALIPGQLSSMYPTGGEMTFGVRTAQSPDSFSICGGIGTASGTGAAHAINETTQPGVYFEMGKRSSSGADSIYGVTCYPTIKKKTPIAAIQASTWYRITIVWGASGITFKVRSEVDGYATETSVTNTTNLPPSTQIGVPFFGAWNYDAQTTKIAKIDYWRFTVSGAKR